MDALPTRTDVTTGVIAWLKLTIPQDDLILKMTVGTALAFVSTLPIAADLAAETEPENELRRDRVAQGTIMLASRLFRRRNSPSGVEAQTEAGVVYVARHDSDVSRLLGLDQFAKPQVG